MTLEQRDHWPRAAPHPYRFCALSVKERLDHKGRHLKNAELWNPKVKGDLDLPRAVGRKQGKFSVCSLWARQACQAVYYLANTGLFIIR